MTLLDQIRAYAIANYEDDGWDILVECWCDDDIVECIGKAKTLTGAIKKIKAALGPVHDYSEDIRATAF